MSEPPEFDFDAWPTDDARLRKLMDANARSTRRSARLRFALRVVVLGGGGLGILLICLGAGFEIDALALVGLVMIHLAALAMLPLFFLGGLAPAWVRGVLSDRERELLDN
jgi:hypothetical protein